MRQSHIDQIVPERERPIVLIADDDRCMRLLLRATLEGDDCGILEAANGEEAVAMTMLHHPDLILLDLIMPGMSGLDVLSTLRASDKTGEIPVIVLTANHDASSTQISERFRVDAFLTKPFSPLELIDKVDKLLIDSGRPGGAIQPRGSRGATASLRPRA